MRSSARLLSLLLAFSLISFASVAADKNDRGGISRGPTYSPPSAARPAVTHEPTRDPSAISRPQRDGPPPREAREGPAQAPPTRDPGGISRPGAPPPVAHVPPPPPPTAAPPNRDAGGITRPGAAPPPVAAAPPPVAPSNRDAGGITRPGAPVGASQAPPPVNRDAGGIVRPGGPPQAPTGTATTATPQRPPVQDAKGISRPAIVPSAIPGHAPVAGASASDLDKAFARGQSKDALAAFRADQEKFKAPPLGAPMNRQQAVANPAWKSYGTTPTGTPRWGSADAYYAARQNAIGRMPPSQAGYWRQPPPWVADTRSSYHGVSGGYLNAIVGTAAVVGTVVVIETAYSNWAYAHRRDEAYREWHADMMRQAEHNEEVRLRMAALNARVSEMESQNVTVDPNALPEGVDPSLVVASDTVLMATASDAADEPTGGQDGVDQPRQGGQDGVDQPRPFRGSPSSDQFQ
jgi:hypothetical protein